MTIDPPAEISKWISIKDQLPDEFVSVLVSCDMVFGPMQLVAYRYGDMFVIPMPNTKQKHVINIEDVTDWQHLPPFGDTK